MSMLFFPPEILTKIFSHISKLDILLNVQHVSSYWCNVVFSSEIWILLDLGKSHAHEIEVIIEHCHLFEDHIQHLIVKYDDFLKFLTNEGICNMRNVKNLQIINYVSENEVTFFQNIVKSFPTLKSIRCRLFRSADIAGCLDVLSQIQFIDFSIHMSRGGNAILWNKCLKKFVLGQHELCSLSVHSPNVLSKTVSMILPNMKCIRSLDLSNSTAINGSSFERLPEMCSLVHVDLTSTAIDDLGLGHLSLIAKNLKSLNIINCENVTDYGLREISDHCCKLESLFVVNLPDTGCGPRLSTTTVKKISKNCTNFRQLCFAECVELSDGGLFYLALNCHNLQHVQLQGEGLSSTGLKALSENCFSLRYVDLEGDEFSVDAVEHVLTNHLYLEYLSIDSCVDLAKLALNSNNTSERTSTPNDYVQHCHVKKIKFPHSHMNEASLLKLLYFCPDVRFLMFSWTEVKEPADTIERLFLSHKFLKTLEINGREFLRKDFIYRSCCRSKKAYH